jgi:hypothetical protein
MRKYLLALPKDRVRLSEGYGPGLEKGDTGKVLSVGTVLGHKVAFVRMTGDDARKVLLPQRILKVK